MNILSLLKRIKNYLFSIFSKKPNRQSLPSQNSSTQENQSDIKTTSSFNVKTEFYDVLGDISKLKEDVSEKLTIFKKAITDITDLKEDAKKAVIKSEKTESLVYLGFFALIFIVIGLSFGYIEFVYSGSKNNDYKYNLTIEIAKLQSATSILEKQAKELNEENKILNDKIDCAKDKKYWQYEQCFNK